ncbi:MAG: hypothetical protein EA398_17045 [Deltaproteobacteria bacterium]|nr:MAG: hypothetical protein EA398_17045 [Deltaproteobacteria bacterium]
MIAVPPVFRATGALLLLFACASIACGGGDGDGPACRVDTDCERGRSCIDGECRQLECRVDADCEGGTCDRFRCVPHASSDVTGDVTGDVTDTSPDTSPDASDPSASGDATGPAPSTPGNGSSDPPPPTVQALELVEADPAEDASDASIPFTLRLRFNQPLDASTFVGGLNLRLRDPFERLVPFIAGPDEDDPAVLVVEPAEDAFLRTNARYQFHMNTNVRGSTGGRLDAPLVHGFGTAPLPALEVREAWAEHYAPVLHQQVIVPRIDTFTRVDFDGDLDATNNLAASTGPQEPWVYWSMAATSTHVFLHYLLYFPGGNLVASAASDPPYEHQFVGVLVVVRRTDDPETPFGRFEAALTSSTSLVYERAWRAPAGQDPAGAVSGGDGRLPAADLVDGHRLALFLAGRTHVPCPPSNRPSPPGDCSGADGPNAPFGDGLGRTFLPRTDDEDIAIPAGNGLGPFPYGLLPMETELWARRHLFGDQGDLFQGTTTYDGPAERPPAVDPDAPTPLFPNALRTEERRTEGVLPFDWGAHGDSGTWIMDPVHYVSRAGITLPGPIDDTYCLHPYLDLADPEACAPLLD